MRPLAASTAIATCCLFVITACGDPAPGEGVDSAHQEETMPEVVSASEAIASPDIATMDLHSMEQAQYEKVIPEGPRCTFAYSLTGRPVFAAAIGKDSARGAVMIHGRLVELAAQGVDTLDALAEGGRFSAESLSVHVIPEPEGETRQENGKVRRQADAILEVDKSLRVGYAGWYSCEKKLPSSPRR